MPGFVLPCARALHRPTEAGSLSKRKWTLAWSRCCAHRNAYPLDPPATSQSKAPLLHPLGMAAIFAAMKSAKFRWIALGAVGGGVLILGILGESWRTLDRYWPRLNEYLHSGTPSTQSDVEYLVAHFLSDAQRLDTLCVTDISSLRDENDALRFFKECRAQILAAKPIVDDMHARFEPIKTAWANEQKERVVPADCRNAFDTVFLKVGTYLSVWDREIAMFESVDPDSAKREDLGKAARRMAELEEAAVAALNALKEADPKFAKDACKGY
jgi:hypothetical protein